LKHTEQPCKASKSPFLILATKHHPQLYTAIVYEHTIDSSTLQQDYNIRAFPTFILFIHNVEKGRVQGVDFLQLELLLHQNMTETSVGLPETGYTLGGSMPSNRTTMSEAHTTRIKRLEQLEGEKTKNSSSAPVKSPEQDTPILEGHITINGMNESIIPLSEQPPIRKENDIDEIALEKLTSVMGFSVIRSKKGLLYSNNTIEGAIDWLGQHQDDETIDDPIAWTITRSKADDEIFSSVNPKSYICNDCNKLFPSMNDLERHATKSGHSDFSESRTQIQPLTGEEKREQMRKIKVLVEQRRKERLQKEKADDNLREKQRRKQGKQMGKMREDIERDQRKRIVLERRKEQEDDKKERERILKILQKEKTERTRNNGRLFKVTFQNEDTKETLKSQNKKEELPLLLPQPKSTIDKLKLQEYIDNVASYKAGGDGLKCLRLLHKYLFNILSHPNEPKYQTINMDNKIYRVKVKPFLGAKNILLAIGFVIVDRKLHLEDNLNLVYLKEAIDKIQFMIRKD